MSTNYKTENLRDSLDTFIKILISELNNPGITIPWNDRMQCLKHILQNHFTQVLAETRKPINDVSLMDQTSVAVAFLKAALVERVVERPWKPLMDSSNKPQYLWRVLSISIDTPDYVSKVSKLPDLLSRKERIEKAQERARQLIEVEYPLGTEIYRDQSVVAFLVPDKSDLLDWTDAAGNSLKKQIERIYIENTDGEIVIQLQDALMIEGNRSIYKFGNMLNKPIPRNIPDLRSVKNSWKSETQGQVCTNCQLRLQGLSEKAQSRSICDTCLDKRISRSKNWCTSELHTTGWIDEVADNNARLAILTGRFELGNWLNGLLWNSVLAILDQPYDQLSTSALKSLNRNQFSDMFIKLIDKNVRDQYKFKFDPYFDEIIWSDWKDIIPSADQKKKAHITAIHLLRQTPSFARIRRVWETTQQFFRSIQEKIESGGLTDRVPHRLIIKGAIDPEELDRYQAYDTRINGIETSFVWDSQQFISTDNLQYLAKQLGRKKDEDLLDCLKRTFERQKEQGGLIFYRERETGGSSVQVATLKDFVIEAEAHNYAPTVPILTEPQLFMTLIPANKAMDIAQYIQTEYEVQFSKVRNRLPLHLSLIFFHRRLPLYSAMDAARRMLNRKSGSEIWTVKEDAQEASSDERKAFQIDERLGQHVTKLHLDKVNSHLKGKTDPLDLFISYSFGDDPGEDSKDHHYPYFYTEHLESGNRTHQFSAPLPDDLSAFKNLVHVSELKKGDTVYYIPSTFDFEFLDTTARRFEIQYENGRRAKNRFTRPYFLEQIKDFQKIWDLLSGRSGKKGLTNTQINTLEMLIENRRDSWKCTEEDPTFQQFVEDSLKNIDRGKNSWWKCLEPQEQRLIRQAALSGMLADVLEIYTEIMKQKSKWG